MSFAVYRGEGERSPAVDGQPRCVRVPPIAELDESVSDTSMMETSMNQGPDSEDLFMSSWCMQQDEASPSPANESWSMLSCRKWSTSQDTPVSKNPSRRVLSDRSKSADQIVCVARKRRDCNMDSESSASKYQKCSPLVSSDTKQTLPYESPAGVGESSLPITSTCHNDLAAISGQVVKDLLDGKYTDKLDSYCIVDCRYPYEYNTGHIKGAINLYTGQQIRQHFFESNIDKENPKTTAIIFHCEFSSKRGPRLCRLMRNLDRELNRGHYPHLHYPQQFILDGGYSTFFTQFQDYCEPRGYMPMAHKDYRDDLRKFKVKSKTWPLPADRVGNCKVALRF